MKTPICLDESIHTVRIARDAIAAERLQDHQHQARPRRRSSRVDSTARSVRSSTSIPVWHGGMLETGIGRAHNIHLASLPNFSLPGDIAASKRYYQPDLIEPAIEVACRWHHRGARTAPGIGVHIVPERVERATLRAVTLDPLDI